MKGQTWFTARAGAKKAAEISIYDEIGGWGVSAADFRDALRQLGEVDQINLSINSPGGSVFDGIAIHNLLARHKARVVVTVDGLAASIASVIAMAGDEINMPENSMLMIHNPAGVVIGQSKDMREMAEALDKVREAIVASYVRRSKQNRDDILEMMDAETWLTAAEAVELGFADNVAAPVKIAANFDLSRFKAAPTQEVQTMANNNPNPNQAPTQAPNPNQAPNQNPAGPAPGAPVKEPAQQPAQTPQQPNQNPDDGSGVHQPSAVPSVPHVDNPSTAPVPPANPRPSEPNGGLDPQASAIARDIHNACALAGAAHRSGEFLAQGKSLSEVLAALRNERAGGEANAINTHHQIEAGAGSGAPQPLRVDIVADMKKRTGVS